MKESTTFGFQDVLRIALHRLSEIIFIPKITFFLPHSLSHGFAVLEYPAFPVFILGHN